METYGRMAREPRFKSFTISIIENAATLLKALMSRNRPAFRHQETDEAFPDNATRTAFASRPAAVMRIFLYRRLWPASRYTACRGTPKRSASQAHNACFALPSTGGAFRRTFSAPLTS